MALEDDRERVLAVWVDGFPNDDDVVSWADRQLVAHDDAEAIPTWLLDLGQHGPAVRQKRSGLRCPEPLESSHRFALRVSSLNFSNDDVLAFANCAGDPCGWDEFDRPESLFTLHLDVCSESPPDDAFAYVREELPALLSGCRTRASELLCVSD